MAGHRRSTRLPEYHYGFGTFFISLVVEGRRHLFGPIIGKKVQLSGEGRIVMEEWLKTPIVRPSVQIDEYIVMPDHFQAVVIINGDAIPNGNVGVASWRPCPMGDNSMNDKSMGDDPDQIHSIQPANRSLAKLINQFKATTTRQINELRQTPGQPVWQRNYHDRIIRNEVELDAVRKYIQTNPERG